MTDKSIKCKKCNNNKLVLVIDRYNNGDEIQRFKCFNCNTTYNIILGDVV